MLPAHQQLERIGYTVHPLSPGEDSFFESIAIQMTKVGHGPTDSRNVRQMIQQKAANNFEPKRTFQELCPERFAEAVGLDGMFNPEWIPWILQILTEYKIYVTVHTDYEPPVRDYSPRFVDPDKNIIIVNNRQSNSFDAAKKMPVD